MTNMESLYGSGKFTEIMQSVKLTEIKKITAKSEYTGLAHAVRHALIKTFYKTYQGEK
ncbi:MAG: hypothetical protein KIG96_05100 [Treponema sp.]|nr:hypothetical protein [Treponema sp.]